MSDTLESLRRKINRAGDLKSVVRTMKVLAASNIVQYEKAVNALKDYSRTVELGLVICLRQALEPSAIEKLMQAEEETAIVVAFGSDQGLVGQFNDVLSDFMLKHLEILKGEKKILAVGERMEACLEDTGLQLIGMLDVPNSVHTITPLVGQILLEFESCWGKSKFPQLYLFYNRSKHGAAYEPYVQRLLPLDEEWLNGFAHLEWPTKYIPETVFQVVPTLQSLIRNYLFVSIFRSCAESLASENASRLAAMQRAEKNIDELLEDLNRAFHRLRQNSIDEELFDVISGSEALSGKK